MENQNRAYIDIDSKEISPLINQNKTLLVDVRDEWEFEEFNIGGMNIPMSEIREKREFLSQFQSIIVVCTNGIRSKIASKDFCRAEILAHTTIYHVKGGLLGFVD